MVVVGLVVLVVLVVVVTGFFGVTCAAAVPSIPSVSAAAIPNFETMRVIGLLPLCPPVFSPPRVASGLCTGMLRLPHSRHIERRRSSRHRTRLKQSACRRLRFA